MSGGGSTTGGSPGSPSGGSVSGGGSPSGGSPVGGSIPQSSGRSSMLRPGHSSHRPQVFSQSADLTQRGHASSSSRLLSEQAPPVRMSTALPAPSSIVQHPKQSQPFGVRA